MGDSAKIAAVIPAYNEADKVAAVVEGSLSFVGAAVVVDDCSSDRTREAARRGMRIVEAPVTAIYRDEESKINPFKDTCRFIRMLLRLVFVDR